MAEQERLSKAERLKMLEATSKGIEKEYGEGTIMAGNFRANVPIICSTGSLKIDSIIGGGIPKGRIIEVYGPEQSGKTSLCLHIIAGAQANDGLAAFVDAEHALDPSWAKRIGVNMEELRLSQPENGEQALSIVEKLVDSNAVDIIVVDSVAALVPKAEMEGEMGQAHMGLQARLMSQAMRKLVGKIYKSNCTVVFINQIRSKIGVMFGNPEVTTGGNALKFYATMRIDTRNRRSEGVQTDVEGLRSTVLEVKTVKNKIAPPFKKTKVQLHTGLDGKYGYDIPNEVLDIGVETGIIERAGAWYSYKGEKLGQGVDNAVQALESNEQMYNEVHDLVIKRIAESTDRNDSEIGMTVLAEEEVKEQKVEPPKKRGRRKKVPTDAG